MNYILKHFDTDLLKFSADENSSDPNYNITWINKDKEYLLPLDFKATPEGLRNWIKHRVIPKNRAYAHNFLAKCGLNINRPMNVISVSKGLSLNDCYWVVDESFEGSFEKYNLYENNFSNILAYVAFTGYGSSIRTSLISSPEFTTNGMLPKCWRRMSGKVMLYKGGTTGFVNTGKEPYSEYLACQVAEALGMNVVKYNISKWKGNLCSTCELFTSKELSYMPVGRVVTKGGITAVKDYIQQLGDEFVSVFNDMIVLDAVICNIDRHFGNFGFLVDNETNKIKAPSPLFDHGNSLFNFASDDDMKNSETLQNYVDTLRPCVYDDFIDEAKKVMTHEHRVKLHALLNFEFKRHTRYNLPKKRLKLIEDQIHKRAKMLLD
jgi:hypothetical protein